MDLGRIASYAGRPLDFVMDMFPWGKDALAKRDGPWPWQRRLLEHMQRELANGKGFPDVVDGAIRIARSSGHGVGKSTLVAWIILWAMSTCEDCRGVVTANTKTQLETKTRAELAKWHRLCTTGFMFKLAATALLSVDPAHEMTWRMDFIPWTENNPEAFAGLHNKGKRILLIFDEASAIADVIWETAEGALTDVDTEIIWCAFGNPTKNTGRFRDCFGRFREMWDVETIDARDVPGNANRKLHDEWVKYYGEDSDFVRVRVRGVFPRAGSMQFIPSDIVDEAMVREIEPNVFDPLIIGVDVARYGSDASVIYVRKGRDGRREPIKLRGVDTMTLAGRVVELAGTLGADAVFIDGTGVGGGVVDRCRQLGLLVVDVQFGAKPDGLRVGLTDGVSFANKRAEIWGLMREWLKTGGIPNDPELRDQLIGVEYSYTGNQFNAIQLERKEDMKKRGLESPDIGDALALTFALPVVAQTDRELINQNKVVTDWDPFAKEALAA